MNCLLETGLASTAIQLCPIAHIAIIQLYVKYVQIIMFYSQITLDVFQHVRAAVTI